MIRKSRSRSVCSHLAGVLFAALCGLAAAQSPDDKITSSLRQLDDTSKSGRPGGLAAEAIRRNLSTTPDGVVVSVLVRGDVARVARQITRLGVTVLHVGRTHPVITVAAADMAALEAVAAIDDVVRLRSVPRPITHKGRVTGQHVKAQGIDVAAPRWGVTGAGQKVGVLSDSFANSAFVRGPATEPPIEARDPVSGRPTAYPSGILRRALNQDTGDLPGEVEILLDGQPFFIDEDGTVIPTGANSDEGAGMAELIHDIAPGAAIAFHSAFLGEQSFADGIIALADAGCSVIVDDVLYLTEPMYQDGPIAQAAREVVRRGIPYFSSAGNSANTGLRFNFRDSNPLVDDEDDFPPTGNDLHLWDNGTPFLAIGAGPLDGLSIVVQWNQPHEYVAGTPEGGAQVDFDIYFVQEPTLAAVQQAARTNGQFGGSLSNDRQGTTGQGAGNAVEFIGFGTQFQPESGYLVIAHRRGRQDYIPQDPTIPLELRLVVFGGSINIEGVTSGSNRVGGPTMYGHSIAEGVVSVGAVPWFDTTPFTTTFPPTALIDPQDFTSLGGIEGLTPGGALRVFFEDNGTLRRNSFTGAAAPSVRNHPVIAAVNGSNTTFFGGPLNLQGYEGEPDGFPNFFGTSASAPIAAAIAALMLEIDPSATPADITRILRETAIDVVGLHAAPGIDDRTGAGLVDGQAALAAMAARVGRTPVATPTATPRPLQRQEQRFDLSTDGWIYADASPALDPALGSHDKDTGALVLTAPGNTNTFGFYASPEFIAGPWERQGDLALTGAAGTGSLFRAAYQVRSTVPTAADVPALRLRASHADFSRTHELQISSATPTNISPTSTRAQTYQQFFSLPAGQSRFRLFFDILNFGAADAANSSLLLDRVQVDSLSLSSLEAGRQERTYDFASAATEPWSAVRTADYFAPEAVREPSGLRLGPAVSTRLDCTVALASTGSAHGPGFVNARTVQVYTSRQDCVWSATASDSWIELIAPTSGIGNGAFRFTLLAMPPGSTEPRSGFVSVNGVRYEILQGPGAVRVDVSPSSTQETYQWTAGHTGHFNVIAPAGMEWKAYTPASWLAITPTSGVGPGTIHFTITDANPLGRRFGPITVERVMPAPAVEPGQEPLPAPPGQTATFLVPHGPRAYFGFWSSPQNPATAFPHPFSGDRLYRARYTVSTNATLLQRGNLPTFRARFNDSSLNMAALLTVPAVDLPAWINEWHYMNNGADANEGVEIAGPAGLNLDGWQLAFYAYSTSEDGGAGWRVAKVVSLSGTIPSQAAGFGTRWFPIADLPDGPTAVGVALITAQGRLLQALASGGAFTALDGPVAGAFFADIRAVEGDATPALQSLQLQGTGNSARQFNWAANITRSPGSFNPGQNITEVPTAQTYEFFFAGRPELAGNQMLFSFDYLMVLGQSVDPNLIIRLERVQVDSWPLPIALP